jgi:hypothetical protein
MQRATCRLELVSAAREVDRVVRVASVGRAPTRRDEPTVAELAQVVRDEILRLVDEFRELSDRPVAVDERPQEAPSDGMSDQLEEPRRSRALHVRSVVALSAIGSS